MRRYDDLIYTRDQEVDGTGPWYWLKADTGAWDGPKVDWENNHRHKWLSRVKDFSVCVQAGACLGMYPRLLARHFGSVYAFEPDRLNFYVASKNCQADNVYLFNCAVGRSSGTFSCVKRNLPDNVGMHKVDGPGDLPIMAIDSLELPVCGLLALDIEGYELEAVSGALRTIDRCSPVVTLECPGHPVRQLLTDLGYSEVDVSVSDTVFARG